MVKITYVEPDGTAHAVDATIGTNVMEGALNNGIPGVDADCGGACACATCHVYIDEAWLARTGPATDGEEAMLDFAVDVDPRSRLSCQIEVTEGLDGLVVHLPASQRL